MGNDGAQLEAALARIEALLQGSAGGVEKLRTAVSELREEGIRLRAEIDLLKKSAERWDDHLEAVPDMRAVIEKEIAVNANRLANVERLAGECAGKISEREKEEKTLLKSANLALVEKEKETTRFRRAFWLAAAPIGLAILSGIGYAVKLAVEWYFKR